MKKNIFNKFQILFFISVFALAGCTQSGKKVGIGKPFKHNTPLIKTDVKKLGKKELEKSAEMGPIPVEGDIIKLNKRKKISSVKEKNYLLIPDDYDLLKQKVTLSLIHI